MSLPLDFRRWTGGCRNFFASIPQRDQQATKAACFQETDRLLGCSWRNLGLGYAVLRLGSYKLVPRCLSACLESPSRSPLSEPTFVALLGGLRRFSNTAASLTSFTSSDVSPLNV